ncbi:MAG: 50S ribosomal protein L28 [Bacillota bacterium]
MAKCAICDKRVVAGNRASHSNVKTKRTWAPNLKKVKAIVDGSPRRIVVCTRCLRSGKVERAL